MRINNILNKTFQYPTSKKSRMIISISIGSFVFILLSVFQPFNLWNIEIERRFFVAFGYGVIAFAVVYLNHRIACRYLKTKLLSVWGFIFWYLLNSFTTALFSSIFNDIIFNSEFLVLDTFLKFQYFVLVLFAIPSAILILVIRNYRIKNIYLTQMNNNQNAVSQIVTIHAENPSNDLKIDLSNLIYITSTNNYVDICYHTVGKVKHILLRNTIKSVEADLKGYSNFCRCHKGYIIDLRKVNKMVSTTGAIKLHLDAIEELIPVSRSLAKTVKERLKEFAQ
jgi:hypothetical protein